MTFFFIFIFMLLVFWRPQEWLVPALYGVPMLDVVFIFALLAFIMESNVRKVRIPKEMPQVYLIPGLFVAAIMSHLAHTYFAGMISTIEPTLKLCFFTFVLFCVLDRWSRLRTVVVMFVVMACVMAVHALMQERLGYGFAGQRPLYIAASWYGPAYTRSLFFGIFEDPNDLSQILATCIPFAFCLTRRRSIFGFLAGCGITWLLVSAIFATHSRGGIVALAAVTGVMFILMLPARWMPVLLGLLAVGALAMTPFSGLVLDDSAHDRVTFWGEANWAFKRTPLFGVGSGMMAEYISGDRAAHNAFVLCYSELGVFGYWFWFSMIQLGVVGAWRARAALRRVRGTNAEWIRRFSGLSIAAMGGFCASAYFLSRAYIFPMFFMMALLGAIPVVAKLYLPEDHPPLIEKKRDVYKFCTLGSLGSIVYIYVSIRLLNMAWF